MTLQILIDQIEPPRLAEMREKNKGSATRDKERLLKKVDEVYGIAEQLGYEIKIVPI